MLLEQQLDLIVILFKQSGAFPLKLGLDLGQLPRIVRPHLHKLQLHRTDQLINMVVHLLHRLDIVFVLCFDRFLELVFETVFILDDLLALYDLRFDILAVFFFLKFLPVPVDLDVLLVGGDHFVLDLVCAVTSCFLLVDATLVLGLVRVRLYLGDR
jgi:hypothetical protein